MSERTSQVIDDANFVAEVREELSENPSCHVCGAVMVRPWRVGRKVGRTLYYREQLVGLVDNKEIAQMIVKAMNKSWHCRSCGATTECS